MHTDRESRNTSLSTGTLWWSCALLIVLSLAVGLQTLRRDNYFLGDDFGLIQHLHDLPASRLLTYFASDWTEGIYGIVVDELRPFLAFTYWLDAHLFGPVNTTGYHATNVVLHALNALLVLALARSIAPREPAFAILAASFFVFMPSHAEPIAWISGRVDSLASLFYLGAFLCFVRFRLRNRRPWLFAALAIFACGLFAKQSVVTLPVLIVAFDRLWLVPEGAAPGRSFARVWPHVPFFVLAALYLALRHALFGNAVREDLVTVETIKEFIDRQDRYYRELIPTPDNAPKAMRVLAEVLTLGIVVVCGWWVLARRAAYNQVIRRLRFFGAAWYVITIAPMVVTYISARHLYITSAGLSIALAALVLPAYPVEERRKTRIRVAMVATLIVLYGVASVWNASKWVASGVESQRFATALPVLLRSVPRGSIVFIGVPEWYKAGWFWSWATPFALQPPFTDEDLYEAFRIVERPPMYCCPPQQWWAARKATLTALMDSPAPQQVTYIEFARDNPGAPSFSRRTVDGQALKRRVEAALGKSVESVTATITQEEALELSRVVFE